VRAFGRLLIVAGLDLTKCKLNALPLSTSVSCFKKAELNGKIEVESKAILFLQAMNIKRVNVTASGEHLVFYNVTSFSLRNYEKILLKAGNVSINKGKGLYAALTLNKTAKLEPTGNNTSLKLKTSNGEFELSKPTEILLVFEKPFTVYARTPSIKGSGNASLIEAYLPGSLKWRTQTWGQNLNIAGIISFNIYLSDSYTLAENLEFSGSFNRSPPIVMFDEWSVLLPVTAFWAIVLLPIFLSLVLMLYRSERTKRNRELPHKI